MTGQITAFSTRRAYDESAKPANAENVIGIGNLPRELILLIFSYGKPQLMECALVCRRWKELAYDKYLLPEGSVDGAKWEEHIGEIGPEKAHLSLLVHKDFDPEEDLVTFLPLTVNGKPLTANEAGRQVNKPKKGHATGFQQYCHPRIMDRYGDIANPRAVWYVVKKKSLLPKSRGAAFDVHQEIVKAHKVGVPEFLGIIVSVFMRRVITGEFVFPVGDETKLSTYTRVKQVWGDWQVTLGGFSAAGLRVSHRDVSYDPSVGVAGARKSIGT